jgi:hypothetical protein
MQRFSATGNSEQGSAAYSTMHIRIESLRARAVRVPVVPPHQTASGTVTESPLVLIDVVTDQSVIGHSIVFTYTAAVLKPTAELVQNLAPLIEREALAPAAIEQKLGQALPAGRHARARWDGTCQVSTWLFGTPWRGSITSHWSRCSVDPLGRCLRTVRSGTTEKRNRRRLRRIGCVEGSPGLRRRSDTPPLLRISLSSARFAARSDEMPNGGL